MTTTVCAITGSRAEFGVLCHILKQIERADGLNLQLVACGMHLVREFGYTIDEIKASGFTPAENVEMMLASDTHIGMGKSLGLGVISFTDCLARLAPDIILLIGDRYETFAAATAAMALGIPVAHISGGEITEGAIDEQIRHAITKMSHVHFVATEEQAVIVRQMGEEPWRVHVVGGPWMDGIKNMEIIPQQELSDYLGVSLDKPTILVTFHPVTLQTEETQNQITNLLAALEALPLQIIFTYPNADAGGRVIIDAIKEFCDKHTNAVAFQSFGSQRYLNLLRHVCLMVGNSSSGMVETQHFRLPVVNVGIRQQGRRATDNILSCPPTTKAIRDAIEIALSAEFRKKLSTMTNPYDAGGAAHNIVKALLSLPNKPRLLTKKFSLV